MLVLGGFRAYLIVPSGLRQVMVPDEEEEEEVVVVLSLIHI